MDERDVADRLQRFGAQPLDADLTRQVETTISTEQRSVHRRRTRTKIAGAAVVGFFVGSLGLASAGALPASLQDKAQEVLDRVGVNVPAGHDRYNDPTACPEGPYKNHGEYVRTHKDDPTAGQSPCGKPVQSIGGSDGSDASDAPESEAPESEAPESDDDASESSEAPGDKGKDKSKSNGTTDDESSADELSSTDSSESTESSSSP
ncbi:MAG: hypothetical protein QOI95_275 [Acidimicrobiaceae bacterium]|jgi:hypothetical protein